MNLPATDSILWLEDPAWAGADDYRKAISLCDIEDLQRDIQSVASQLNVIGAPVPTAASIPLECKQAGIDPKQINKELEDLLTAGICQ